MPSLLSRFLGKKKNADPTPLLDGEKYEVVVPKTPSPSVPTFPESAQRPPKVKTKEQSDRSFGIPIRRKQGSSGLPTEAKAKQKLPMLSLHLPDSKLEEKRLQGLGVMFEGIAAGPLRLDDEVLGTRRLTPSETLTLVQKTSEVICERALDTLGVMRPHWFASQRQQEVQLQLINRFLQTLSGSQTNGVVTGSTSSPATFESELRYTRDPHDVAAVLRWGLRHLQLEGHSFGSTSSVDWYRTFADSERSGSYPSKAFDDFLVPLLPVSHAQLLCAILELVSSLAAHSEENGISGNKLSKVLGWWIVSSRDVQGLEWREFYTQWEAAARQFEHIFLAYIRAQQAQLRMPKRLTELVKNYPYTRSHREDDGIFLPRSRFSTRSATALLVRVTADKSSASSQPHPLRIVEDAFKADAGSDSIGDYVALWENIRTIASKPTASEDKSEMGEAEACLNLSTILADETIRLLSLVPAPDGPSAPTLSLFTSLPRRSYSSGDKSLVTPIANGGTPGHLIAESSHNRVTASPLVSNQDLDVATDWQAFSNAGFNSPSGLSLAASLWDTDTEVSQPVPKKGAGAGKRNLSVKSGSPRRASADCPHVLPASSTQPGRVTYGVPQIVKLDEAFIDFWADTLLDSIARSWPTFVVCQLKTIPTLRPKEGEKPIEWLVIERILVEPTRSVPPPVKTSAASARGASPTPTSPTRSEASKSRWTATTLAATRKRWSMFTHKHESAPVGQRGRDVAVRRAAMSANVGEMGEILKEEDEGHTNGVTVNGKMEVNGTTVVNGVKDKKETQKKQDAMPSQPAIHIEGVSNPDDTAITNREEVMVTKQDATLTIAEPTSPQDVPVIVNKLSDAPKQAVETTVQSQLPIAEIPSNTQPVTEPAPRKDLEEKSSLSQKQLALASEEPKAPVAVAAVAETSTSPKVDLGSSPLLENTVVPKPQSPAQRVPNVADPELKEEPRVSTPPKAEHTEPTETIITIGQEHSVEDSSLWAAATASDAPAEGEAVPTGEDATSPLKDALIPIAPAALKNANAKQPSSVPDPLTSREHETPLRSEPLAVQSAVSQTQHGSIGFAPTSVEESPAEVVSGKPEVVPAAEEATVSQSMDIVAVDREPQAEVVEPTTVEHAQEEGIDQSATPEVPAEHVQQSDNLGTHDVEVTPTDVDLPHAEPVVSEPHSETYTDGPATIDPEPDIGGDA